MKKTIYLDLRIDIYGFESDKDKSSIKKELINHIRRYFCKIGSHDTFSHDKVGWYEEDEKQEEA